MFVTQATQLCACPPAYARDQSETDRAPIPTRPSACILAGARVTSLRQPWPRSNDPSAHKLPLDIGRNRALGGRALEELGRLNMAVQLVTLDHKISSCVGSSGAVDPLNGPYRE